MDIPAKVWVTCPMMDWKNQPGTLIAVYPQGFYEIHVAASANTFSVYVPVAAATLMTAEPLLSPAAEMEIER